MVNSAGVNFGRSNEEFIIESDGNGALTSARNAVTGDEYVGGGGGDFSVAHITVNGFSGLSIRGAFIAEGSPFGDVSIGNNTTDFSNNIILYKGKAAIEVGNTPASISGNIELIGGMFYLVTGDCTLNY